MDREQPTRKKARELQAGDRMVCEDGTARVIASIRPGPFPAMFDVSFDDGTSDLLPAVVSFDVLPPGKRTAKNRMRVVKSNG
jgi:hypothetical protein